MMHARPDYNDLDALNAKIPVDEPVFLLRAQDKHAATVVRVWAALARADGDPRLVALAEEHAQRMDAWPVKKSPDLQACDTCKKLRGTKVGEMILCDRRFVEEGPWCGQAWRVIQICLGCGKDTDKSDCGCPAGTCFQNEKFTC